MPTFTPTARALAVIAAGLLIVALFLVSRRHRFIANTVPATATIEYVARRSLGATPAGERFPIEVRKLPFHLYRRGQIVRIRYNPARNFPGQVLAIARIDSFAGLWLAPLGIAMLAGLVLLAAWTHSVVMLKVQDARR